MKLQTNIAIATLISLTIGTTAIADTAGDSQTVSVTIPSVKLLDVKAASGTSTAADEAAALAFTLVAPTIAGENFVADTHNGFFDVTSNVASGGATTRKITVSADTLGEGWKLDLDATGATNGTGASVSFTNADVAAKDLVTAIGNEAGKDNAITYTFGPESATIVPSYTGLDGTSSEDITLTFTLSDDA
ncbi:MAG: hypothetical protein ACPG51_08395 [Thiolinea sp.]